MIAAARFTGWRKGFQKVPFTKLLMERAHLPFSTAKRATDDLLEGKTVEVSVEDAPAAQALVRDGQELGAIGEVRQDVRVA